MIKIFASEGLEPIAIVAIIIFVLLILILIINAYRKKTPIKLPITHIKNSNGDIIFKIFQEEKNYKVVNLLKETEPAIFIHWEDVVSYIQLEMNNWQ